MHVYIHIEWHRWALCDVFDDGDDPLKDLFAVFYDILLPITHHTLQWHFFHSIKEAKNTHCQSYNRQETQENYVVLIGYET